MTSNDETPESSDSPSSPLTPSEDSSSSGSLTPTDNPGEELPSRTARFQTWFNSFKTNTSESIKNFQILSLAEWASKSLQKRGASFFGMLLTILLSSYFLSNIAANYAGRWIPEAPHTRPLASTHARQTKTIDDYGIIFTRNLFSSAGLIPGEETSTESGMQDMGGPPVRTSLPFNLVGTLILMDETRSIATIEDKGASTVYPVRIDDEIPAKAKIVQIEPGKVTFINLASGRREFIDLPEDAHGRNPKITLASNKRPQVSFPGTPSGGAGSGIEQHSPTNFNIARTEIDKAMADFNNILTQARAVPNFENGAPNGYKLFQIVPGSIYQKLGFQNGDIITQLNGESANDPAKALSALQSLKDQKHYEISGKRDGRPFTYSYDFQ